MNYCINPMRCYGSINDIKKRESKRTYYAVWCLKHVNDNEFKHMNDTRVYDDVTKSRHFLIFVKKLETLPFFCYFLEEYYYVVLSQTNDTV